MVPVFFSSFFISSLVYAQSVLMIRHGEALHNVQNIHNGDIESSYFFPLTSTGQTQLETTSHSLKDQGYSNSNISALFVSPCLRTLQSAWILKKDLNLTDEQVVSTPLLSGPWRGRLEGQKRLGEEFDPAAHASIVGGESYADLAMRLFLFLSELCKREDSNDLIIVSHGTPIRVLESLLEDLPEVSFSSTEVSLLNRWAFPLSLREKLVDATRIPQRPKNGEIRKHSLTPFCSRFKRQF